MPLSVPPRLGFTTPPQVHPARPLRLLSDRRLAPTLRLYHRRLCLRSHRRPLPLCRACEVDSGGLLYLVGDGFHAGGLDHGDVFPSVGCL